MSKIKTKWIPKTGERFWAIFSNLFMNKVKVQYIEVINGINAKNMFCFKTKKQAESARKKILEILRGGSIYYI